MDEQPADADADAARALALAADLRVLIGKLSRRLRAEVQPLDLTWSQLSVLTHLEHHGPATVTTLARAEGVRPQSMGATVAVLEAAGLVTGAADPTDGRQTIFSLTAAFRDAVKVSRAAREDWLFHAIRATLAPGEQEALATGLALLQRLVGA